MVRNGSEHRGCFVEVFTDHYQVTGHLHPGARSILDYLNAASESWLPLHNAGASAYPPGNADYAASVLAWVRRASILFVIPHDGAEEIEATPSDNDVILGIPPYEIRGSVSTASLTAGGLLANPDPFVALLDAAGGLLQGALRFTAEVILVNKERVQMISLR